MNRRRWRPHGNKDPIELLRPDAAAAKWLGWTDRWRGERLQRHVFAAEVRQKVEIFLRSGQGKGTRYHVTLGALRKHLPQLFTKSKLDELAADLRAYMAELERRVEESVAEQFEEHGLPLLRSDLRSLSARVQSLETRIKEAQAREW